MSETPKTTHVLWARSRRYATPFVVAAWSDGYREAFADAFWTEVEERKSWIECFSGEPSDGPWEFCLSIATLDAPAVGWSGDPLDPDVVFVPLGGDA